MRIFIAFLTIGLLVLGGAGLVSARMLGGGSSRTDCNVTFEGVDSANDRVVECVDGSDCDADHTVDKHCTFGISVCLCQSDVPGCTPGTVRRLSNVAGARSLVAAARPMLPASIPACSAAANVVVKLRKNGTRPGAKNIRTVAYLSPAGRDSDHIRLVCKPATP